MSTGLVWYRNDLRTKDHEALNTASQKHDRVIGIYCFDPRHYEKDRFGFIKTGKFRARFLIETITELQKNLTSLNIPLLVYQEKPENIIPDLIKENHIETVYFQKEWTQEEKNVENAVIKTSEDVDLVSYYQQFLFHPEDIPFDSFQDIPKVYTAFRKACEKKSKVRYLIETSEVFAQSDISNNTSIPTLQDLGLDDFEEDPRSAFPFKGGEDQAMKRIKKYFWETENLAEYKETRNGLVGTDYSSKLSAWLANGSISPKQVYHEVKRFEKEVKSNQSTYWLIFELIWRDFFKYVSLKHGNKIFKIGGILEKDLEWSKNEHTLNQWIEGNTKYDFVNANMKEIAATGFMSNRGRQNVNSFWAKELKQDWRIGAAYFESLLIDYDVHSNWGNWMYNSGVGNDPRDRKFNIEGQADRYDPDQEYQNLWLNN
ncbi:deoxyribodipyrimidine photo-lyase (single-stranded DNA-specific) [Christiangramia gaetbulicola]|uniref:Cryptochrome DASH n=1 Tax=Christiangramia gaetbulicola TaxID=703340 RepID=A0A2T6AE53_9FLAO|nr:DASH family cryptochrome [Christiangramia gaetbulicola]PTX42095.1 deoxyribodipyrimidine photo-lyase (single-stranded DNA-specific) [Christiangramia gaetbulicola]